MHDDNTSEKPATETENPATPRPISDISPPTPQPPETPAEEPLPALPTRKDVVVGGKKSHKKLILKIILLLLLLACVAVVAYSLGQNHATQQPTKTTTKQATTTTPKTEGLVLDTKKAYGNKYATGLLPVGDGKYDSKTAKVGSVYTCEQYAQNLSKDQGGAGTRGPWFTNNNTQYDLNKKAHVSGNVMWTAAFSNTLSGSTRTITTNDLPNHATGVFPIATSDPAYAYDRNPNTIKTQSLTYALPASPTYGTPNCMGGEAGVMLTGVALFNGFDAGGRDAGAWEVQDNCSGHPQKEGEYHYHTLSSCIKDISVNTVIGYALDGFPITGPTVGPNNILTTSDLDECHGITSSYTLALTKQTVTGYHYVMTQDFPYSVSCFRATAIQPPGQPAPKP
jgi:hypothetical protein